MLVKITGIKVRTTSLQSMNWKRLLFFVFHEIGRYCWEKNTIPSLHIYRCDKCTTCDVTKGIYPQMVSNKEASLVSGLSSLGVPWHPQILADQLTGPILTKGEDYAHQMTLAPPNIQTFRRPCLKINIKNKKCLSYRPFMVVY